MILFYIKKRSLPLRTFRAVPLGFSKASSRILEAVEEKGKCDAMRCVERES